MAHNQITLEKLLGTKIATLMVIEDKPKREETYVKMISAKYNPNGQIRPEYAGDGKLPNPSGRAKGPTTPLAHELWDYIKALAFANKFNEDMQKIKHDDMAQYRKFRDEFDKSGIKALINPQELYSLLDRYA